MSKTTKKRSGKSLALSIIMISFVLVILALGVSFRKEILGAFGLDKSSQTMTQTIIDNKKFELLSAKATLYENFDEEITVGEGNTVNFLVFGMDRNARRENRYANFRPDTIILATVNMDDLSIKLLSLPRDTYVPIHGRNGKDKINACFYYGSIGKSDEDSFEGGIKCLMGTVSDLLGVPINYYAGVDMEGVTDIIDILGGVEVDVHTDVYIKENLLVKKGHQVLNGKQFLAYARSRNYAMGDIGRVDVQQKLLKALFKTVTSTSNITKLPKLVQQAFDMVITNITFEQATGLAFTLMDFSSTNIETDTLPGTFGNLNKISYWIINQSQLRSFAKKWYGVSLPVRTQDPTSDKLQKLTATPSSVSVSVGGTASVSLKGQHADGKDRKHSVSSCSFIVADPSIATVQGSEIVGLSPGSTTITFKKSGKSVTVSVSVY
ncbi:MAG: LCP family protein [Eubacteriaceae bacterium]|nr:LCP family protein [Eubacteriaceae bacterium]